MSDREIKDLKQFLEKCLKKTVSDYKLSELTKPGENYASILQSLVVTVADSNDRREDLHFVAKSVMSNPCLVAIFQPSQTFVKEIGFYSDIIPAIERYEVESNIQPKDRLDAFIKYIGSRTSLSADSNVADADALLILENIKQLNYANENRLNGFDLQTTFLILTSMAKFHALCIALRRNEPEEFNKHVAPYLPTINMYVVDDKRQINKNLRRDLELIEGIDDEYRAKVMAQVVACDTIDRDLIVTEDTPYTTVIHRDLWINNVMLLKDDNGKTKKIKIYDFQLCFYESFVSDLIFFLMTSVRSDDLERNFHIFIDHYHEHFVETLKRVNCPLADYTIDKIWAEIRAKARNEFFHSLFVSTLALKKEADATAINEIVLDTFLLSNQVPDSVLKRWKLIIDLYKDNDFL